MRLPIQIQCIIFRKNKGNLEFLLLKRIPEKGEFWQPVSGGLETTDMTNLDAAYREIKEETGIEKKDILRKIDNVHYFEFSNNYITGKPEHTTKEYVYAFEVNPDVKIKLGNNFSKEHNEFRWVDFDTAIIMLKWENNKDGFKKLYKIIS